MKRRAFATSAAVLVLGLPFGLPAPTRALVTGGGTPFRTDGPVVVRAHRGALLGHAVPIRGSVAAADAGRSVLVERRKPGTGWIVVARTIARPDGTFAARWRADRAGQIVLRAVVARPRGVAAAASAVVFTRVTIYRSLLATWYGPGFYGRRTACGRRLTKATLGVAHRTLPCGSKVALYYRGRSLVVPVVDRGPYAGAASFDLTGATANALHFAGGGRVGALTLH